MLITVCDICGGREKVNRRWYPFDRKMCVAGDSETVGEVFDLCETCELAVLREVLGLERNADMWERIISKIKEKIEFKKESLKQFEDNYTDYLTREPSKTGQSKFDWLNETPLVPRNRGRRNRIADVMNELWKGSETRKRCIELMRRIKTNTPTYRTVYKTGDRKGQPVEWNWVLVIPDYGMIGRRLGITEQQVWNYVQLARDNGWIRYIGRIGKNGQKVYGIGYWTGQYRKPLLTKKSVGSCCV